MHQTLWMMRAQLAIIALLATSTATLLPALLALTSLSQEQKMKTTAALALQVRVM